MLADGDEEMSDERHGSAFPVEGRIAGVDFGTVRIGVSLSDPGQSFASPFENFNRRTEARDAEYFQSIAKEESLVGFVVGLPLHMSGDESQKSLEARAFGKWLQDETGLPVAFHDERFTSADAESHLVAAKLTKKRRKARLDMLAAQLILKSFLESRRLPLTSSNESSPPEASQPEASQPGTSQPEEPASHEDD